MVSKYGMGQCSWGPGVVCGRMRRHRRVSQTSRGGGRSCGKVAVRPIGRQAGDGRWSTSLWQMLRRMGGSTTGLRPPTSQVEGHLVDQVCQATGGPCRYQGREMKATHLGANQPRISGRWFRIWWRRSTRLMCLLGKGRASGITRFDEEGHRRGAVNERTAGSALRAGPRPPARHRLGLPSDVDESGRQPAKALEIAQALIRQVFERPSRSAHNPPGLQGDGYPFRLCRRDKTPRIRRSRYPASSTGLHSGLEN